MATKDKIYTKEYYQEYDFGFNATARLDHNRIIDLLTADQDDEILEIGSGFGVLLNRIPFVNKKGVESNDVAIKECRKKKLTVVKANAEKKLPFKSSSFNFIVMNEVVEHLKDPTFTIKECLRLLKPKGRIIITTPAKSIFVHDLSPTHISEMSTKELRLLLRKCGFTIITQEVSGLSFLYPMLEFLLFKPSRILKMFLKKNKQSSEFINSCHALADKTFLSPFQRYRKKLIFLGENQLILGEKK